VLGVGNHPCADTEHELRVDLEVRVVVGHVLFVDSHEDVLLFLGVDELDVAALNEILELHVAAFEGLYLLVAQEGARRSRRRSADDGRVPRPR